MKSSIKGLFVILAIVMSFFAIQAVWAGKGQYGPDCTTFVEGTVSEILVDDNAIKFEDDTVVYGIPLPWVDIDEGDLVVINAHECPDTGKLMACYLTVNGGDVIELRPRYSK